MKKYYDRQMLKKFDFNTFPCHIISTNEDDNEKPVVSFAIPSYKRTNLFIRLLDSINKLDRPFPFEVVITEDTREEEHIDKIKKYLEGCNFKYRYYFNTDRMGLYQNWNQSISLCKGEYFCLIHTDDFLHHSLLTSYEDSLYKYDVIMQKWNYLYPLNDPQCLAKFAKSTNCKNSFGKTILYSDMLHGFAYPLLGSLIRKSVLNNVGYFPMNEKWSTIEDYIFMTKVSLNNTIYQLNSYNYGYIIEDNCMLVCDGWEKCIIEEFFLRRETIDLKYKNRINRFLWNQFAYIKVIFDFDDKLKWCKKYSKSSEILSKKNVYSRCGLPLIYRCLEKLLIIMRGKNGKKGY